MTKRRMNGAELFGLSTCDTCLLTVPDHDETYSRFIIILFVVRSIHNRGAGGREGIISPGTQVQTSHGSRFGDTVENVLVP